MKGNNSPVPVIIMCGPTASGKSGAAIALCRKFNGEIISADSRQVYKEMDIGTGKEVKELQAGKVGKHKHHWVVEGIPIRGYDIIKPSDDFSVSSYCDLVFDTILPKVITREKIPFLVGGTGFYIKALVDGYDTIGVPPDWLFRRTMEESVKVNGVKALFENLRAIDPARAQTVDSRNPRRIIRALEIARNRKIGLGRRKPRAIIPIAPLFIGITLPRDVLYARIDRRANIMVRLGLIGEVRKLLKKGYSWDLPSLSGIGYIQFKNYLEGSASLAESLQRLKWDTHAYARRQLTWFRKEKRIQWFDLSHADSMKKIEALIEEFLSALIKFR